MVKICIIKFKNSYDEIHQGINLEDIDESKLEHYVLKDNIEDFVEFVDIKNSNQLFEIINKMNKNDDNITIDEFYYDSDYTYQGLFAHIDTSDNTSNINKLGTQFIREKMHVVSDLIIIKRSIINNDFDYENITFEDITNILRSQFLHKAVILKPNGDIIEKSYIYHQLEINFDQSSIDNTRIHECKILELTLIFNIDIKADKNEENYNKFASNIYKKKIYGNVLISLCDTTDNYQKNIDLNKNVIQQLIYLLELKSEIDSTSYNRQISLENLTINDENVNSNKFIHNNFPQVALCPNFYYIINREYEKYKNNKQINKLNYTDILNDIE